MNRTPHGALIPENENQLGRPPRTMRDTPEARAILTDPNLMQRLRELQRHNPEVANEMVVDLQQHYRALNGERSLPGEYMGRDDLPTQPLPFAPRETFRPDRTPGSEAYDTYRTAVSNVEAGFMTEELQARMRSHDSDSPDSTWNRMAPASERTQSSNAPSLRESLSASVDALSPKE